MENPDPPNISLTAFPTAASPEAVRAHIQVISEQVEEHLDAIESLQTSNAALKRKLINISEQIPEAEQTCAAKAIHKEKAEKEHQLAAKVVADLKGSRDEFVKKVKLNEDLEKQKQQSIVQAEDLMNVLTTLSKRSEKDALAREGLFLCRFCGTQQRFENQAEHESKCWGRCNRCIRKKLACDCGDRKGFKQCTNCTKRGQLCEKAASTKKTAKEKSLIEE